MPYAMRIHMPYATSLKWSGFKTRKHHQGFLFFSFYFKDFMHFDDARMFSLTRGFGGIFKNKIYLNSILLFQLNVILDEINFAVKSLPF